MSVFIEKKFSFLKKNREFGQKKRAIFRAAFLLLFFIPMLFSCSNSSSGDGYEENIPETAISQTEATSLNGAAEEKLPLSYVMLSADTESSPSSRTILSSQTATLNDLDNFLFTGSYLGGAEEPLAKWTSYSQLREALIPLYAGEWDFLLTARGPSGAEYFGNTTVTLSEGGTSMINITLFPLGGKGNVDVTLNFPTGGGVKYVTADLFLLDGTTSLGLQTSGGINTETSYRYTQNDIPAGTYIICFSLYADSSGADDCRLATFSSVIVVRGDGLSSGSLTATSLSSYKLTLDANGGTFGLIAPAATTTTVNVPILHTLSTAASMNLVNPGYTFVGWAEEPTGAVVKADGADIQINGPKTLYARWIGTTLYVSSSGDDSKDGMSSEQPVKHVSKALELIPDYITDYSLPTTLDWTIDVTGTITETGSDKSALTIAPTSMKSLTIESSGTMATIKPASPSGYRVLNIVPTTNVDITLKNLMITGGDATTASPPGGGGIYINKEGANFVLDKVLVQGNQAQWGGGVFIDGGNVTLKKDTEIGSKDVSACPTSGNAAKTSSGNYGTKNAGGIRVGNGASLTLESGTYVSGNYQGGNENGGGVLVQGTASFNAETGSVIQYNKTTNYGGGIYTDSKGTVTVAGTVKGNSANKGAGIYVKGPLTVNGAEISSNIASASTGTSNGGGIYAEKNTATIVEISGGTITANEADCGGGIYVDGDGAANFASVTMSGTAVISGNIANQNGGGVWTAGRFNLEDGTIGGATADKNTATNFGGGVYNRGNAIFTMTSGTIKGNEATNGGGVCNFTDTTGQTAKIVISGGTIESNTATENGGGIYSVGTVFMSGTAVIGDKSKTIAATSSLNSNTAKMGGGIFMEGSSAKLYLGYTSASTKSSLANGGIYYNYASDTTYGGGGVYIAGGAELIYSTGNISYNYASTNGGGIWSNATVTMNGGTISGNTADSNTNLHGGGGIYNASSGTVKMSAGTISGNIARDDGGGVLNEGNFFMYGTAVIGDSSKSAPPASINAASNRCLKTLDDGSGGGVFNTGNLYMGYSAVGTPATLTGGIFYNGGDGGGGVYNTGTFVMRSGTLNYNYGNWGGALKTDGNFFMCGDAVIGTKTATAPATATSCGNYSDNVGGGINNLGRIYLGYSDASTTADFTGGIFYNYARTNGGGIGDRFNGVLIQARAGTIAHNTAASNGSGIYYDCEGFNFAEKFVVTSDNDIYLTYDTATGTLKIINVSGTLSPEDNDDAGNPNKSAIITPANYTAGRDVLKAASNAVILANYGCFSVTPQGSGTSVTRWRIKPASATGKLEKVPDGCVATVGATFGPGGKPAVGGSGVFVGGRSVTIPSLIVCEHEVTQAEYETYCNYSSSSPSGNATEPKGPNYPVYYPSWYDAIIYCNLRSIDEGLTPVYYIGTTTSTNPASWAGVTYSGGKYCGPTTPNATLDSVQMNTNANGYRLPTEAEWEYIARDGDNGIPEPQYTYSGSNNLDDVAWHGELDDGKVREVMQKQPNRLGIYDMTGNVMERCWDWFNDITTSTTNSGPTGPYTSGDNANKRTLRGGSFYDTDNWMQLNKRNAYPPNIGTNRTHGIRVVRTIFDD